MADQDDPLQVQCIDDDQDIHRECGERPVHACSPGLPVTGQIDTHDKVAGSERLELEVPMLAASGPAVNKDEGRFTGAGDIEGDLHAI